LAKRILVYTNHYYPEQFKINDLVSWLSNENVSVTVVTGIPNYPVGVFFPGYNFFKKNKEYIGNTKVYRMPLIPRGNGNKSLRIINYLSFFLTTSFFTFYLLAFKKKYDIVITHHTSPIFIGIHSIFHKLFKKSKCFFWELDLWPESLIELKIIKSKIISKTINMIVKLIYRFNDYILISSDGFRNKVNKIVPSNKILYFPNWADENLENIIFKNSDQAVSSADNYLKIYYTGNIGEAQGLNKVLEAMIILKNEPIKWTFVGDGSYKKTLQRGVLKNNLNNVNFLPFQKADTLKATINNADLLLICLQENKLFNKTVPAKLQTYMCFGKPIIGLISGETKKIIENANCGYAFSPKNLKAFTEKLIDIKKMNSLSLKKIGKNGRKYYLAEFHSSIRKKQILKLIDL
jgi:glycosyltransferase involved in cell wall biosynthesis